MNYTKGIATADEIKKWKELTQHLIEAGQEGLLDAGMQEWSNNPEVWRLRKIAPEMYEVLKGGSEAITNNPKGEARDLAVKAFLFLAQKVLSKVEGK